MHSAAVTALAAFVAVFAVAMLRGVHVGLLMFVSACLLGTTVAGMISNTGATLVASAAEADRPRLRTMLLRWSMAMVVVGPVALLPFLLIVGRWFGL